MKEHLPGPDVVVVKGDLPHSLVDAYRRAGVVAWDTETSGLDPRSDSLQLCQLEAPGVGVTLVQLEAGAPEGLATLLSDPDVRIVMHHAPFDLLFMRIRWGVRASNVRCTKIGSKLLWPDAPGSAHSLAELTYRLLGMTLDKGAVRTSDWGTQELSDEQVRYAAADVAHLLDLAAVIDGQLAAVGRTALYEECCAFLPARAETGVLGLGDVFAY